MNINSLLAPSTPRASNEAHNSIKEYLAVHSSETPRITAISNARLELQTPLYSASRLAPGRQFIPPGGNSDSINSIVERTIQPRAISLKRKRAQSNLEEHEILQKIINEILENIQIIEKNYKNYSKDIKVKIHQDFKAKLSCLILLKSECHTKIGMPIIIESAGEIRVESSFPKFLKLKINANLKHLKNVFPISEPQMKGKVLGALRLMNESLEFLNGTPLIEASHFTLSHLSKRQRVEFEPNHTSYSEENEATTNEEKGLIITPSARLH